VYGGGKIKFNILVRIFEGKSIFMRVRYSWNDSIKIDIKIWPVKLIMCLFVLSCFTVLLSNGRQDTSELLIIDKVTPNFLSNFP
jgi:hypothetical protein